AAQLGPALLGDVRHQLVAQPRRHRHVPHRTRHGGIERGLRAGLGGAVLAAGEVAAEVGRHLRAELVGPRAAEPQIELCVTAFHRSPLPPSAYLRAVASSSTPVLTPSAAAPPGGARPRWRPARTGPAGSNGAEP